MTERYTGGPAYPILRPHAEKDWYGMTLWDFYAAAALQGLLANSSAAAGIPEKCAQIVGEYADEMLKERERKDAL